jgi:hypothetical protein
VRIGTRNTTHEVEHGVTAAQAGIERRQTELQSQAAWLSVTP